ncbi:MAG: DUF2997 domain-containing protein [Planctomycetota bacterium]|nr:MAG: DUF2997 domain-containing protein [Planctomycetota bacterium]
MTDPKLDELEIKIDKDGNVTLRVIDGDGERCIELTKELEEALGLVVDRRLTAEYYEQSEQVEGQVEQQG